jgi:hypothetical protein
MAIYFIIYIFLLACGIHFYDRSNRYVLIGIGVFLIFFIGLRGVEVSSDYITYIEYFDAIKHTKGLNLFSFYEPTYVLITKVSPGIVILMLIYAALSVVIKLNAIKVLTPFVFITIAIWFTHFFLVQEMNQIRAAVAISILLLAIPYVVSRDFLKFVIIVLVAGSFHYSALLFIPVYFLNAKKMSAIYFVAIPGAYILNTMGIGLIEILSKINLSILQSKIDSYNLLFSMGSYTKINIYNPVIILRVCLIYILLYHHKILAQKNIYTIIMVKMYVISIVCMVLLSSLPAFGLRIADVFGIAEIILLPFMFYLFKEKWFVLLFLCIFGVGILSLDLFYNKFLNSYSF